ncbi:MAG TPA: potassium transporter TrkA [Anaerolineae bacterium]
MSRSPTLSERIRYAFDNTLAHGPIALIGWLALATALMIGLATAADLAIGGVSDQLGPFQVFWSILSQALTPNPVDPNAPKRFLLVMLVVTIFSLLMVSILIGVLNTAIDGRVQALRRGRSRVIERNHVVILGWSEQILTIISELVIANANRRRSCIVILGDKDKVEMEEEIRHKAGPLGRTRVVVRSGDPIEVADLDIVNVQAARAIIVLSPDSADPDAAVIKTLLAITNAADRRPEPYHIVAEIQKPENMDVARLAGGAETELVLAGDVIARITAQTCHQTGLSLVLTELLNFEGDEIYFQAEPGLTGRTFGEALLAYEDSTVIGIRPKDGPPKLNPPMEMRFAAGDEVIAVSEDDDTVRLNGAAAPEIQAAALREPALRAPSPERTLVLGWNWRGPTLIRELDNYVAPGSSLTVVAEDPDGSVERACRAIQLRRQTLAWQAGNTADRRALDALGIPGYRHVVLLCESDRLDPQEADARTMVTLLHLRDIAERSGHPFSVVSEMLDIRNRNLAEIARADDFIVSNRLTSLLLAQLAENQELQAVFADLLSPEGSEIYLKPATDYVAAGVAVNFYTVVEAARRCGQVALGYRQMAAVADKARNYGVVVNPAKSRPVTFAAEDRIIVLAEE